MSKISKVIRYKALTMKVLTVAVVNFVLNDFTVYIDAVPGKNHDYEFQAVADNGSKLDKRVAEILYPDLFERYQWRE